MFNFKIYKYKINTLKGYQIKDKKINNYLIKLQ